jgi:hypothetical protein
MKRFIVLFTMIFTMIFPFLYAQVGNTSPISAAFKAGSASSLASGMDKEVDITVPGSTKKCNADEATALLNSFFVSNKPTGFIIVHNADKKESGFLVGKLATSKKEFRVNITYRTEDNKVIIQSIRIE